MTEKEKRQLRDLRTEWREMQICAEILRKQCGKIVTRNGEKYVEIGRTSKRVQVARLHIE